MFKVAGQTLGKDVSTGKVVLFRPAAPYIGPFE